MPYTSSQAIRSQRAILAHGAGTPAVYTEVEELTDIQLTGIAVQSVDVTNLSSSSKEFIAGLNDNGSIQISGNYTHGVGQKALWADASAGITAPYKLTLGSHLITPIVITFSGFPTKFDLSTKVDGKVEFSSAIKITGDITITP